MILSQSFIDDIDIVYTEINTSAFTTNVTYIVIKHKSKTFGMFPKITKFKYPWVCTNITSNNIGTYNEPSSLLNDYNYIVEQMNTKNTET